MITLGDTKYTIERIKEFCFTAQAIRTNLFGQTFRINFGSDSETDMKDIQVISIPLQKSLEERIFSLAGITEKQRSLFYQEFATALKDDAKKNKIISQSAQADVLKEHILVFDTIQRERLSGSEMNFYYVSIAVDNLMESSLVQNESIQLSSVFKIWKNLLETIELLNNEGLHLGTIDIEDIFVDQKGRTLIRLPIKGYLVHQNSILKNLLPTNIHLSFLKDGSFTIDTDLYVVNSLIHNILNGPTSFASGERLGPWEKRVSELFSCTDTKDLISILNKAIDELKEFPENDLSIPLACNNESREIKKKLSAVPLIGAVDSQLKKIGDALLVLISKVLADRIPLDMERKEQDDQKECSSKNKKGIKIGKNSLFLKFVSQISSRKNEQSSLSDNATANVLEDKPLKKVLSRKDGENKKQKLDVLKNKKIVMLIIAGALVFAVTFTNLIPSTDPAEGIKKVSEDEKSSFVVANKSDSKKSSHYSAIEKVDDNPENDSTPFSSTYSDDDEDTISDKDETEQNELETSNSSSSSSNTSRSSSGISNSNSSNSSAASSSYKPSTSSSSISSSRKPNLSTTNQITQSTATDTEQELQVVKPISTLSISPNTLELRIGQSIAITPTMTCLFLSDNASVAVVNGGEVIAKGKGTCTITAKGLDGQTYNISVSVTE